MQKSRLDSFLCTGMTSAALRFVGKTPVATERLKISLSWEEISFFNSLRIFKGILKGPVDLFGFREDIMLQISSLVAR